MTNDALIRGAMVDPVEDLGIVETSSRYNPRFIKAFFRLFLTS